MLHRMNSASPSFHSLLCRSKMRGVDATVKFATAAPDGVNRSSGSAVRFPMTVMMVSPATSSSWDGLAVCAKSVAGEPTEALRRTHAVRLVLVGPQNLGPQHGLVQVELTVQL